MYEIDTNHITKDTIILASKSPRRRELMELIGLPFAVLTVDTDEDLPDIIGAEQTVSLLSRRKAEAVYDLLSRRAGAGGNFLGGNIIIGADTVVWNGEIYGKPTDYDDAYRMLRSLSGRRHEVWTGITVLRGNMRVTEAVRTDVYFRELSDYEIERYIRECPPYDKAGGYAIQERAAIFADRVDGDFYNVIGLPVSRLWHILHDRFGVT
ncbi:MAG TPA: septum formation protein Maf [Clostridiales bacterium]|nr:septum formation protein Maf [Clostridiales bacterium]